MSQENWQIIVVYNYGAGVVIVGQKRQREIRNGTEKTEENILPVEKNREKKVTGYKREDRVDWLWM